MYFIARIDGVWAFFRAYVWGGFGKKSYFFLKFVCDMQPLLCVPGDWIKERDGEKGGQKNMQHACMCACACACFPLSPAVQSTVSVMYPRALPASQKGACAFTDNTYGLRSQEGGKLELSDVTVLDFTGGFVYAEFREPRPPAISTYPGLFSKVCLIAVV